VAEQITALRKAAADLGEDFGRYTVSYQVTMNVGDSAEQAAAGCAPLPDGEASPDYLRHLVAVYARQALVEAFSAS
jgi:hypothetical protein